MMIIPNIHDPRIAERVLNDPAIRATLARQSHYWFFHLYFHEHVTVTTASFQREMFALTESSEPMIIVTAFRGSAKSTIFSLSYPVWSIIGAPRKKFVVLLGQTQDKARLFLSNIRRELESNVMLANEMGPLRQEDEWGATSLVLPKYGARITAASREQSVRGIKHGPHRPDLIIGDDLEDLDSVKTVENRDKLYQWFVGDVIPAGTKETQFVLVGNFMHEDSLLSRIHKEIVDGKRDGVTRRYPLLDDRGKPLWPAMFPSAESIRRLRRTINDEVTFQREFLLNFISPADQVIQKNWIHWYERERPPSMNEFRFAIIGADLAISQKDKADYTAILCAKVYGCMEQPLKIIMLPQFTNERLKYVDIRQRLKSLYYELTIDGITPVLAIENVGAHDFVVQQLCDEGYTAVGVNPGGADKRSRLAGCSPMIQNGTVIFPSTGLELLINQMVGFGSERHDDLADAFVTLLIQAVHEYKTRWPPLGGISAEGLFDRP